MPKDSQEISERKKTYLIIGGCLVLAAIALLVIFSVSLTHPEWVLKQAGKDEEKTVQQPYYNHGIGTLILLPFEATGQFLDNLFN